MTNQNKQYNFYVLIKYLCFFVAFYVLGCANIEGLHPFMFGLFFCLVWCNQKIYILAPLYILASFLCFGDWVSIFSSLCTVGVLCIAYIFHYRFKRPFNVLLISLYAILGQFVNIYYIITIDGNVLSAVLTLILGILAMLAYIHFFQNLLMRGVRRRFQVTEAITGGVFLLALINGIYNLPFIGEYAVSTVVALLVLLGLWCFGAGTSVVLGIISGLGVAFATNSLIYIALFACWAMMASAMHSNKRIYSVMALILVDALMEIYFFPTFSFINLGAVLIGALLFLVVPSGVLQDLSNIIITDKENNAMSNLLNKERDSLYKRLQNLSLVFREMQTAFCKMTKQSITGEQIKTIVTSEVKRNVCNSCPNKSSCLRTFDEETDYALGSITNFAINRGKVNIIDVPASLSCRCGRLGAVLNEVNKQVLEYKERKNNQDSQNISKLVIAEQLFGVSQVMSNLAESVASRIEFDSILERQIIEMLGYHNILCIEAVVYKSHRSSYFASIVVRNKDIQKDEIVGVVGDVLAQPVQVAKIEPSKKTNFSVISLQIANAYDMVFGCAGAKKNGSIESGDTHSIMRIGADKYLMALCDGMGSGADAERNSSMAISLIENFYQAGFDSDVILNCVNKLMSTSGDESFNAIDIAVIDLVNGNCDMYKVGSPCSFVKQPNMTELVPAGALPLGILDELKPSTSARVLINGDMVVFLTDGVLDAFGDENILCEFIQSCETSNPQVLADAILNEGLKIYKFAPNDDMTVLVGRIYKK